MLGGCDREWQALTTPSEIREILTLRGWSPARLAFAVLSSERTIRRWLDGDARPTGERLLRLRQLLANARAKTGGR